MPDICIIGRGNSGKTTIFNKLTKSKSHTGNWPGVTVGINKKKCGKNTIFDLPGIDSLNQEPKSDDHKITQNFIDDNNYDLIINVINAATYEKDIKLTQHLLKLNKPLIVVLNKADQKSRSGISIDVRKLAKKLGVQVVETIADRGYGIDNLKTVLKSQDFSIPAPISTSKLKECASYASDARLDLTNKVDKVALHKYFGPLIFFIVMFTIFCLSINLGKLIAEPIQEFIHLFFTGTVAGIVPEFTEPYVVDGIGGAIELVAEFAPIIAILYLLIGAMEQSGYMPRAAYVMDRMMKKIGLSGKSFIPLVIGFGCNVPAVMALRTLESRAEKIGTAIMIPFMSCGARLSVYTVLGAAFFEEYTTLVVFFLYIMGMLIAILSGYIAKKITTKPDGMCFLMELPKYTIPKLRIISEQSIQHTKEFVFRAGRMILVVFLLFTFFERNIAENNVLDTLSKSSIAIFKPIGIAEDNWSATAALFTGVVAKELVVASINASDHRSFVNGFNGYPSMLAYLVFVLLYFPCLSTFTVMAREISYKCAFISLTWSMSVAYVSAVVIYNLGLLITL